MYNSQDVIARTGGNKDLALADCKWPNDDLHYIPDWVYTSHAVYDREVERIFHGRTWNFVALEAELPNTGDYKRSFVGPTPVVVARAEDGSVNVFENRCAHRGAEFCRHSQGNAKEFVCPYHQWSYDLKGNLQGVPFKRGVNRQGGMPKDFRNEDHGLKKLHVTTWNGVVFASYHADVEPIEEYLTPEIIEDMGKVFDGRKLKVLGYYRNELPCNWKMYHENLKDPYHATLLHSFLVVFGLLVAGNKSAMIADPVHGRHGTMASAKSEDKYAAVSDANKAEMRSYHEGMRLLDERFLDYIKESDSPWSVTMQTIWPNLIVQREMNTLGVRQIVPNGPNSMIMQWTMFGYEDDTEKMTRHRLRQGNLMGPAGFLGLEDNEAMKYVQEGLRRSSSDVNILKLDHGQVGTTNSLISEAAIRALYRHYREIMEL
ncbi:aromatic ring-hydroxylating dioxygenase subunit alpha [Pseudomonas sp. GL-RE-26]|uniref:aromatic ring-hydroxylating dioxygenase subunit alpha n=1 Tax=Pseudomonas sp. GL-RE-26 TaxID=2832390 RepID=UPI001CBEE050|nr:aromatic ring-hydroxylating dioxygenase subunit alpha [Pseudomonas sp. GL-RE-26]